MNQFTPLHIYNRNYQIMYKNFFLTLGFVASLSLGFAQSNVITATDIQGVLSVLASDSLAGRKPGTPGGDKAASYIRDQFMANKIKLLGDKGFQKFDLITNAKAGNNNTLNFNNIQYKNGIDFTPLAWSANASISASVVFVGYGFQIKSDSLNWDDYEGIAVKGKWVMVLRGDPEPDKQDSKFVPFSNDRDKAVTAKDMGAIGILFVSPEGIDKDDRLPAMFYDKSSSSSGIPVLHIKREIANKILPSAKTIQDLENQFKISNKPSSFQIEGILSATSEVIFEKVETSNVIGMIEGSDPTLKNEYVVIGAHYDHLGLGGPGSGSRNPDTVAVHNGADDNASGVAGIIELASKLQSELKSLKRSILVVAFGAEESGIIGSRFFIDNPPVPKKQLIAMINFDMIGRLNAQTRSISIGGTGTSEEAETILNELLANSELKASFSPEGYGPSDHASFYGADIPVFYFNTGVHTDYHTPADDTDKINFEGEAAVVNLTYGLIMKLAGTDQKLTFKEAGPKKQARMGRGLKVTFGIMPDFTNTEGGGLGVGGVTKDGPADKAGMKKGDKIMAIDGKPTGNIYEYMNRLKTLQKGQRVSVDIQRDGQNQILIIQL